MTKVVCATCDCKYCDDNSVCTKDEINLSECFIQTVNEGQQTFNKCKSFEERDDEWYLQTKEAFKSLCGGLHNV